jgi:hypothetical protein
MAFYATEPGTQLVGPGVARCEYGGFLLVYPRGRLWPVWEDRDYAVAQTCGELLLLAALDYSRSRQVVYVAATPPPARLKAIAGRVGFQIAFVPLGAVNARKRRDLRRFHVLASRDVRGVAGEFVQADDV